MSSSKNPLNNNSAILQQAALSVINSSQRPAPEEVQQGLLNAEKASKQQKTSYSLNDLVGHWRLCFITGTRKTRQRAGVVLGAGRYVPSFVNISLTYALTPDGVADDSSPKLPFQSGSVVNQVKSGPFQIDLSGPVKLLEKNNILAFDFTKLTLHLSQLRLYQGAVRGGKTSEANFYQARIGQQAFFNYFLVQEDIIAARGKGGGLALWGRQG